MYMHMAKEKWHVSGGPIDTALLLSLVFLISMLATILCTPCLEHSRELPHKFLNHLRHRRLLWRCHRRGSCHQQAQHAL